MSLPTSSRPTGMAAFYDDLRLILGTLPPGYQCVRDTTIRNFFLPRIEKWYPDLYAENEPFMASIPHVERADLLRCVEQPSIVLLSVGTSIFTGFHGELADHYPGGRLLLMLGCSAFNCGYAGISLYETGPASDGYVFSRVRKLRRACDRVLTECDGR